MSLRAGKRSDESEQDLKLVSQPNGASISANPTREMPLGVFRKGADRFAGHVPEHQKLATPTGAGVANVLMAG